ncbi:MAG: phage holin family protein [Prevotella sp.]|nr:phage holin family protein [Prevotella sp.]MBS5527782.1 phage holin family protein [Prevotella sp.]
MFSNDRNIGIVGRLIEMFRHYIGLQNEYLRLDVIEKVVRLITGLLIFSAMFLFIVIILIYLSFAAAYAMGPHIGYPGAFCIVAAVYIIIVMLFFLFRKTWIEKPLIRFITGLLMEK